MKAGTKMDPSPESYPGDALANRRQAQPPKPEPDEDEDGDEAASSEDVVEDPLADPDNEVEVDKEGAAALTKLTGKTY